MEKIISSDLKSLEVSSENKHNIIVGDIEGNKLKVEILGGSSYEDRMTIQVPVEHTCNPNFFKVSVPKHYPSYFQRDSSFPLAEEHYR